MAFTPLLLLLLVAFFVHAVQLPGNMELLVTRQSVKNYWNANVMELNVVFQDGQNDLEKQFIYLMDTQNVKQAPGFAFAMHMKEKTKRDARQIILNQLLSNQIFPSQYLPISPMHFARMKDTFIYFYYSKLEKIDSNSAVLRKTIRLECSNMDVNCTLASFELRRRDGISSLPVPVVKQELGTVKLERLVEKTGFHRDLTTIVTLPEKMARNDCRVILLEWFTSGIYIDIYQLEELYRMKQSPTHTIAWNEKIDLEKPSTGASPTYAAFETPIAQGEQTVRVSVPIHFRYQQPLAEHTHVQVPIRPPVLIGVSCHNAARPEQPVMLTWNDYLDGKNKDIHNSLFFVSSNQTSPVRYWHTVYTKIQATENNVAIPVGQVKDGKIVTIATLTVTVMGAILLSVIAFKSAR